MATVRSDRLVPPTGLHDRRVLAWLRSRGDEALAGRAVWCVAALPGGHAAGHRLRALVGGQMDIGSLAMGAAEPPAMPAPQLDAVVVDERIGVEGLARITALIPAGLVDTREVLPGGGAARARRVALAWTSLLGDILEEDRADHVGGTIQARPAVAAR